MSTKKKTTGSKAIQARKKRPVCCWVSEHTAANIKASAQAQERTVAWVVSRILEKAFSQVV